MVLCRRPVVLFLTFLTLLCAGTHLQGQEWPVDPKECRKFFDSAEKEVEPLTTRASEDEFITIVLERNPDKPLYDAYMKKFSGNSGEPIWFDNTGNPTKYKVQGKIAAPNNSVTKRAYMLLSNISGKDSWSNRPEKFLIYISSVQSSLYLNVFKFNPSNNYDTLPIDFGYALNLIKLDGLDENFDAVFIEKESSYMTHRLLKDVRGLLAILYSETNSVKLVFIDSEKGTELTSVYNVATNLPAKARLPKIEYHEETATNESFLFLTFVVGTKLYGMVLRITNNTFFTPLTEWNKQPGVELTNDMDTQEINSYDTYSTKINIVREGGRKDWFYAFFQSSTDNKIYAARFDKDAKEPVSGKLKVDNTTSKERKPLVTQLNKLEDNGFFVTFEAYADGSAQDSYTKIQYIDSITFNRGFNNGRMNYGNALNLAPDGVVSSDPSHRNTYEGKLHYTFINTDDKAIFFNTIDSKGKREIDNNSNGLLVFSNGSAINNVSPLNIDDASETYFVLAWENEDRNKNINVCGNRVIKNTLGNPPPKAQLSVNSGDKVAETFLVWTLSGPEPHNIDKFIIEYSITTGGVGQYDKITELPPEARGFHHSNLNENQYYYYRVISQRGDSTVASDSVRITTTGVNQPQDMRLVNQTYSPLPTGQNSIQLDLTVQPYTEEAEKLLVELSRNGGAYEIMQEIILKGTAPDENGAIMFSLSGLIREENDEDSIRCVNLDTSGRPKRSAPSEPVHIVYSGQAGSPDGGEGGSRNPEKEGGNKKDKEPKNLFSELLGVGDKSGGGASCSASTLITSDDQNRSAFPIAIVITISLIIFAGGKRMKIISITLTIPILVTATRADPYIATSGDTELTEAILEVEFKDKTRTVPLLIASPKLLQGKTHPAIIAFPPGGANKQLTVYNYKKYLKKETDTNEFFIFNVQKNGMALSGFKGVPGAPQDTDKLEKIIPEILKYIESWPVDMSQIFLVGSSNGGIAALSTYLLFPDKFAGCVLLPGLSNIPVTEKVKGKNFLILVGEKDRLWKRRSREIAEKLRENGANVDLRILKGQGHMLEIDQDVIYRWINETI